jgi:hypothetical protein
MYTARLSNIVFNTLTIDHTKYDDNNDDDDDDDNDDDDNKYLYCVTY